MEKMQQNILQLPAVPGVSSMLMSYNSTTSPSVPKQIQDSFKQNKCQAQQS